MADAGVWIVVDEDGVGDAVRRAVAAQGELVALSDPFSARRVFAAGAVAGVIVILGKRALSLASLCQYVRERYPSLPLVVVRTSASADDTTIVAIATAVIDDGTPDEVTERLAAVSDTFVGGDVTEVGPPPVPPPAQPRVNALPRSPSGAPWAGLAAASAAAAAKLDADDDPTNTNVGNAVESSESEEERRALQGPGAQVLVQLAASRRTGRLLVSDGEGAGMLHVIDGAPVGAELPTGDGGLYRRLVSGGILAKTTTPPVVRQGRLMRALVQAGLVSEAQRASFERAVLRDAVLAVARQPHVSAVFVATSRRQRDRREPTALPPLNVLGLVLEARRQSVAPEVLEAMWAELAPWRLIGSPALAAAAGLVAPFCGGRDVLSLLRDTTIEALSTALGWDTFGASLFVLALRDAGLLELAPRRAKVSIATGMTPRQLLGVGIDADQDEIDAAYAAQLARLATAFATCVNEDDRRALERERDSYDVARQALRLQLGMLTRTGTNPF
jgi:hypothetical protein